MDGKIVDFQQALNRKNTATPSSGIPEKRTGQPAVLSETPAAVTQLLPPAMHAPRFYPERVREFFDQGIKEFFEALDAVGRVTVINYTTRITYESDLLVEKPDGTSAGFPVHSFVWLTAPDATKVTVETIEDYLLQTLSNWNVSISLREEEDAEGDRFDETALDETNLDAYFPERLPILTNPNGKDREEYACYFSELDNYVSSISPEHFTNPSGLTLLEMMCLAYVDFLQAGNDFDTAKHLMVVKCERNSVGVELKTIPLSLVRRLISDSIARKDVRFSNFSPENRIWKYAQSAVLPRVNPEVYVTTYSE